MRALAEAIEELQALRRPVHPGAAGAIHPQVLAEWRTELNAWRASRPEGEARYCELLAEIEHLEAEAARTRATERRERGWAERVRVPTRTAEAAACATETEALQVVREWWNGQRAWCVLLGGVGVGKSVAAAWALRRAAQNGYSCGWLDATDAHALGGYEHEARLSQLRRCDVLALDDYGTEHDSDFARSVLHGLLSMRHEHRLRTVVTCNLAGTTFRERLGVRLADRIRNDCVAREFRGQSLRVTSKTHTDEVLK